MTHAGLNDMERDELQRLLDGVAAPLEPLDVSMLDGFLCGVLVQPGAVPPAQWLPQVTDIDGRALPRGFNATRLHELVLRRHAQLERAITRREWFDPWVFELAEDETVAATEPGSSDVQAVLPWVAGFAAAMHAYPALMTGPAQALTEPLAMLYRHLDPDDLEDAAELLETIDELAPLSDLTQAVEDLVRATLLLADVARPLPAAQGSRPPQRTAAPRRRAAPRR